VSGSIFLIDAAGTLTLLASGSAPVVTADGKGMVFLAPDGSLTSMPSFGGATSVLAPKALPGFVPTPDGKRVIFLVPGSPNALSAVPLAGGAAQTLATTSFTNFSVAPDGSRAAWSDNLLVKSVPLSGGTVVTLATNGGTLAVGNTPFSADSAYVLYSSNTGDMLAVRATGGTPTDLGRYRSVWFPDHASVLTIIGGALVRVPIDGSPPVTFSTGMSDLEDQFDVASDGATITYYRLGDAGTLFIQATTPGATPRSVASGLNIYSMPRFTADGQSVVFVDPPTRNLNLVSVRSTQAPVTIGTNVLYDSIEFSASAGRILFAAADNAPTSYVSVYSFSSDGTTSVAITKTAVTYGGLAPVFQLSSDGARLWYRDTPAPNYSGRLVVVPAAGGTLVPMVEVCRMPYWAGNRTLIATGAGGANGWTFQEGTYVAVAP
jgi:hypothetical protein